MDQRENTIFSEIVMLFNCFLPVMFFNSLRILIILFFYYCC